MTSANGLQEYSPSRENRKFSENPDPALNQDSRVH
jgi:hypothetical protein